MNPAFKSNQKIKDELLNRLAEIDFETLQDGMIAKDGSWNGLFWWVDCKNDLNLPIELECLIEKIYFRLSQHWRKDFLKEFLGALNPGFNLDGIYSKFLNELLTSSVNGIVNFVSEENKELLIDTGKLHIERVKENLTEIEKLESKVKDSVTNKWAIQYSLINSALKKSSLPHEICALNAVLKTVHYPSLDSYDFESNARGISDGYDSTIPEIGEEIMKVLHHSAQAAAWFITNKDDRKLENSWTVDWLELGKKTLNSMSLFFRSSILRVIKNKEFSTGYKRETFILESDFDQDNKIEVEVYFSEAYPFEIIDFHYKKFHDHYKISESEILESIKYKLGFYTA